ncbi:hypothetical protein AX16_009684 [Volvariella volvacea WC 439]|nr:hypothetical protein AX16_009684 [Volvariella volvacea WC 439]
MRSVFLSILTLHGLLATASSFSQHADGTGWASSGDRVRMTLTRHRHQHTNGQLYSNSTNILQQDLSRAKVLQRPPYHGHQSHAKMMGAVTGPESSVGSHDESLQNLYFVYSAAVGVGSNGTTYNLLIDTGSANTWLGAHKPYQKTNTSYETNDKVAVEYGSGGFEGIEYLDTVSLSSELIITNQSIGVATRFQGFKGLDGVLGLGPVGLTKGTLKPSDESLVPTALENLHAQGRIPSQIFGVSFSTTDDSEYAADTGELTWGGIDESRMTTPVHYVPIANATAAGRYWGFDQSITYGNTSITGQQALMILNTTSGIVDTGTSLVLLNSDAFEAYMNVTGAKFDFYTGLLRITPEQYKDLKSLYFHINGATFEMTPNAQIWPRRLNKLIGGSPDSVYLVIGDLGSGSVDGGSIGFINGLYSIIIFDIPPSASMNETPLEIWHKIAALLGEKKDILPLRLVNRRYHNIFTPLAVSFLGIAISQTAPINFTHGHSWFATRAPFEPVPESFVGYITSLHINICYPDSHLPPYSMLEMIWNELSRLRGI